MRLRLSEKQIDMIVEALADYTTVLTFHDFNEDNTEVEFCEALIAELAKLIGKEI